MLFVFPFVNDSFESKNSPSKLDIENYESLRKPSTFDSFLLFNFSYNFPSFPSSFPPFFLSLYRFLLSSLAFLFAFSSFRLFSPFNLFYIPPFITSITSCSAPSSTFSTAIWLKKKVQTQSFLSKFINYQTNTGSIHLHGIHHISDTVNPISD